MAEKQILGFKPAARLEQVDDQHSERAQDCKHRPKSCDDSASRRESRPDGIFGKDSWSRHSINSNISLSPFQAGVPLFADDEVVVSEIPTGPALQYAKHIFGLGDPAHFGFEIV